MNPREMMGFTSPGDHKVAVTVRDWEALKLAIWRSKVALEIAARRAIAILERCKHADGCQAATIESEPCLPACPDRELRMDALVILNATIPLAPDNARKLEGTYFAPTREYFSEVLADLGAAQLELQALRSERPSVMLERMLETELESVAPKMLNEPEIQGDLPP